MYFLHKNETLMGDRYTEVSDEHMLPFFSRVTAVMHSCMIVHLASCKHLVIGVVDTIYRYVSGQVTLQILIHSKIVGITRKFTSPPVTQHESIA